MFLTVIAGNVYLRKENYQDNLLKPLFKEFWYTIAPDFEDEAYWRWYQGIGYACEEDNFIVIVLPSLSAGFTVNAPLGHFFPFCDLPGLSQAIEVGWIWKVVQLYWYKIGWFTFLSLLFLYESETLENQWELLPASADIPIETESQ